MVEEEGQSASGPQAMRELASMWVRAQPAVSAFVTCNVSDIHHAEDLIQEVAQITAEKFTEFDRERSFTSWALGIARNRILKYYRAQSRDRLVLSEAVLGQLADALVQVDEDAERRRDALRSCLKRIKGRQLRTLELRYRDAYKVSEIAEQLATSASVISVTLFRVRKALLECIQAKLVAEES